MAKDLLAKIQLQIFLVILLALLGAVALPSSGMATVICDLNSDGRVTAVDALKALQMAVGLDSVTPAASACCESFGDGKTTAGCALLILREAVGLVNGPTLVSIAITPANPSIAITTTQQFTATGTFSDDSTQNLTTSASWNSSSTSVATIGASGLANSVAAGSTTITATSGTVTGSTTLSVTEDTANTKTYSVGHGPQGIAIDGTGNAWVTNTSSNNVTKLSPSGTVLGTYAVGSWPAAVAIDGSGNVWVANLLSNNVTKLSSSGSVLGTYEVGTDPGGIAIDGLGNIWVANGNLFYGSSNNVTKLSSSGSVLGTYEVGASCSGGIAIDGSGNVWVTNGNIPGTSSSANGTNVTKLGSSGAILGTYPVGTNPIGIAIDGSGNVWVANYGNDNTSDNSGSVTKLSPSGDVLGTFLQNGSSSPAGSISPEGASIAIDGANNVWVVDGDSFVIELSPSGALIYYNYVDDALNAYPFGIAIDSSGNIWFANNGGGSGAGFIGPAGNVSELIDVASPVNTPLFLQPK